MEMGLLHAKVKLYYIVRKEYCTTFLPVGPQIFNAPGYGKFRYGYPISVMFSPELVVSSIKSDLMMILQLISHSNRLHMHIMHTLNIFVNDYTLIESVADIHSG